MHAQARGGGGGGSCLPIGPVRALFYLKIEGAKISVSAKITKYDTKYKIILYAFRPILWNAVGTFIQHLKISSNIYRHLQII